MSPLEQFAAKAINMYAEANPNDPEVIRFRQSVRRLRGRDDDGGTAGVPAKVPA
tara:strand:+ start:1439 stop:1600 length:162 start_codon:yes stop_codon:yes gene_type:complete